MFTQKMKEMELISTHVCMKKDIGVHNNLFGGLMLAWLDESGAAYVTQKINDARIVTVKMSEVIFKEPIKIGQIVKIYGEVLKVGTTSITIRLKVMRHKPETNKQKEACHVEIVFVKVDDYGEPCPIGVHTTKKIMEEVG